MPAFPSRPTRRGSLATALALGSLLALGAASARAGEAPRLLPPGDPDRKAMLDVLRPALETELSGPVEFVVKAARTQGHWGHVHVEPQRPGGGAIDLARTTFADQAGIMDGLTTDALLQKRGDRWYLITHVVGPTDAAASNWTISGVPLSLLTGRAEDE